MLNLARIPQSHPFRFQLVLASFKTWAADYIVQTTVEQREEIDWKRSAVFLTFGAVYSGGVQYAIFVNGFSKWFPSTVRFTQLPLRKKLKDVAGQLDLVKQIAAHAAMSTLLYLPTYYTVKEAIQGADPLEGQRTPVQTVVGAMHKYKDNFWSDNIAIQAFWCPMDILIFGMLPMWARMPMQHTSALIWTMILSKMRGGPKTQLKTEGHGA
jgi:hypothetical protein